MQIEVMDLEIAKLCLQPGQLLAVRSKRHLDMAQISSLQKVIAQAVPEGVKTIVLGPDMELMAVEPPNEE